MGGFFGGGGGGGGGYAYSSLFSDSVLSDNDLRYLKTFCPLQPQSGPA